MAGAQKNFIGKEGFVWWLGIVEDRNDPEQLGRIRVRCFGWHTEDKKLIPTELLPWAHTVLPVNNPAAYTPKEGDMVMGFFMDGVSGQNPVVMGILPGKPSKKPKYDQGFADPRTTFENSPKKPGATGEAYPLKSRLNESTLTRLARNKADDTVVKTKRDLLLKEIKTVGGISWAEPQPTFNPKYPYNFAHETESGHAFELDDTPGKERVSLSHRTGTSFEYDSAGNKIEKVVKDNYYVLFGNDFIFVAGNVNITVDGNCNLKVIKDLNVEAANINLSTSGAFKVKASEIKVESTGTLDVKSSGAAKVSGSTIDVKSDGAANFTGGGAVGIKAGGSVALTGSSVEVSGTLNAGSTNLKATGNDSRGDSHNLNVAGPGGSSAASATEATESGLEFTEISPQTIPTSNTGSSNTTTSSDSQTSTQTVGKTVGGTTTNTSETFNDVNNKVDTATKAIDSAATLPAGEVTQKINEASATVNKSIGEIQNLPNNMKQVVYEKIDNLQQKANVSGFVTGISDEVAKTANNFVNKSNEVVYTVAKHTYPKTEVVLSANTQSNT